jgi:ABC-type transporter Mla subunit MlaD
MSSFGRNILIGLSMLLGLALLAGMILQFGDAPAKLFAKEQLRVRVIAPRADGLSPGSGVMYRGVGVGRVTRVSLEGEGAAQHVRIDVSLNKQPSLPRNLVGVIRSQIIGGTSVILLQPRDGQPPEGTLLEDDPIDAQFVGVDLLPPEFAKLAEDMRLLAQQFRESKLVIHLDELLVSARQIVQRADHAVESVQKLVDDPKMREDLRLSIANFRSVTESAQQVAQNLNRLAARATTQVSQVSESAQSLLAGAQKRLDEVARQVGDSLAAASRMLAEMESAARKLHDGKGTASRLLNDASLYEALLDSSRSLNLTIKDLKRVVEQWEQEGIPFKPK